MNDGSIGSTFNEGHMTVEGEDAYCVDINTNFKNGYKTRSDASTCLSDDQISNAVDYDRIYNWLEYSRTELPHMCDVLKKLPLPDDRQKAVYVMHMPPAGLRLGQLRYQDLDIGSVDIYEFLKEKQPLLSLHGHIHESPDTEKGKWINQIHQTTCIQTGQTELNDKYMVYAEIDLQEKKYERKVISVD